MKIVPNNEKYGMEKQLPYEGTKPMHFVQDVDNKELLKEIVTETCKGLQKSKK